MDRPLRIYLWLAFGITWGFGGLGLLAGAYQPEAASSVSRALHYVAAFGPSLAGLIMAASVDGRAGLRRLLVRAIPRWAGVPWYVAVIIGYPAVELLAAWLGLVPRQHSTGGKERLLGISKRGDGYLRKLFVHGARR